jgi:hypothetical protein
VNVAYARPPTLMELWHRHRRECCGIGSIVAEARAGQLPGVEPLPSGLGFAVINQRAALAAMRKAAA